MTKKDYFLKGFKDGTPIALGYFAVSFALGIAAKNAGLNVLEASFMSLTNLTSAGQFAALDVIIVQGTLLEMAICQFVINLRYFLMSCALSQKITNVSFIDRLLIGYSVTDEIFALEISSKDFHTFYSLGIAAFSIPGWTLGTALGVLCGNILPLNIVSALSVALYAMFIAIVVPPSKEDKHLALFVLIAMITSFMFDQFHWFSSSIRTIVLTVSISLIAALLFPIKEVNNEK